MPLTLAVLQYSYGNQTELAPEELYYYEARG